MTILKVQYLDEIRRITLDKTCISVVELENKIRYMFPQISHFNMSFRDDDGNVVEIKNEEELLLGCAQANARLPPILRVMICSSEKEANVKNEDLSAPSETAETEEGTTSGSSEDETSIQGMCSHCQSVFADPVARYKCINCLEVVLCESCEAKSVHNPIHLLVKLRQPLGELSLKQQLIFTSHIEDGKERALAKAQNKAIRRAMREAKEASQKKKEERLKARKERMKRRTIVRIKKLEENREKREKLRLKKKGKKHAQSATSGVTVDVVPLVPLQNAILHIPSVEPTSIASSVGLLPAFVDPVEDPAPQEIVEEVAEFEEIVDLDSNIVESFDKPNESEPISLEVDVEAPQVLEEQEQSWSVFNLMNGFKVLTGLTQENQVINVNDYRIQGIAFSKKLEELEAMGFADRSRNIVVLMKHLSNLERAVEELIAS